jgi:hypothetical protein
MLTFFTTTTAPPWDFTAADDQGNVIPVTGASFTIEFVNVSNNQKVAGNGTWSIIDANNGHFRYQLSSTDLANAYATTGTSSPGAAIFDICNQIIIGSVVYDPNPCRIMIRKI